MDNVLSSVLCSLKSNTKCYLNSVDIDSCNPADSLYNIVLETSNRYYNNYVCCGLKESNVIRLFEALPVKDSQHVNFLLNDKKHVVFGMDVVSGLANAEKSGTQASEYIYMENEDADSIWSVLKILFLDNCRVIVDSIPLDMSHVDFSETTLNIVATVPEVDGTFKRRVLIDFSKYFESEPLHIIAPKSLIADLQLLLGDKLSVEDSNLPDDPNCTRCSIATRLIKPDSLSSVIFRMIIGYPVLLPLFRLKEFYTSYNLGVDVAYNLVHFEEKEPSEYPRKTNVFGEKPFNVVLEKSVYRVSSRSLFDYIHETPKAHGLFVNACSKPTYADVLSELSDYLLQVFSRTEANMALMMGITNMIRFSEGECSDSARVLLKKEYSRKLYWVKLDLFKWRMGMIQNRYLPSNADVRQVTSMGEVKLRIRK